MYFKVSNGAFLDARTNSEAAAGHIHVKGVEHRDDYMRRLANCGCTDIRYTELTAAEYRALVLSQFPQLAR